MCHETSHVHARPRLVQESPVAQNKRQAKKKDDPFIAFQSRSYIAIYEPKNLVCNISFW